MNLDLYYREVGSNDGIPVVILHGLFGSSDNWMSIAKQLGKEYKIIIPDQRNHGQSSHSDLWDYTTMANDVFHLIEKLKEERIILMGHSMGGKVAMTFSYMYPNLIEKLVVVDISPRYYPVHHQAILKGLKSIDVKNISTRKEADDRLSEFVSELGIRQFLLKNLERTENGSFDWKLNLPVIDKQIENIGAETIPDNKVKIPTLFIGGTQSQYISDQDKEEIKAYFVNVRINMIADAGHWVHAEKPVEFMQSLRVFLEEEFI